MQLHRVEQRDGQISLADDQGKFRATEHHALDAPRAQGLELQENVFVALRFEDSETQFLVDDPVEFAAHSG